MWSALSIHFIDFSQAADYLFNCSTSPTYTTCYILTHSGHFGRDQRTPMPLYRRVAPVQRSINVRAPAVAKFRTKILERWLQNRTDRWRCLLRCLKKRFKQWLRLRSHCIKTCQRCLGGCLDARYRNSTENKFDSVQEVKSFKINKSHSKSWNDIQYFILINTGYHVSNYSLILIITFTWTRLLLLKIMRITDDTRA